MRVGHLGFLPAGISGPLSSPPPTGSVKGQSEHCGFAAWLLYLLPRIRVRVSPQKGH